MGEAPPSPMKLSFFSNEPPLTRRLGAVPRSSIHAFPNGVVGRIVGKAGCSAEEKPVAPLTGRACVAWVVHVTGADPYRGGELPAVKAQGAAPFTVSDETGNAVVHTGDVSLLLAFDVTETLGIFGKPPPRLLRFLREHGRESRRIAVDWRLTWQEGILTEGQRVAVVGRGRHETDPDAGEGSYRAAATRLVMAHGGEGEELFVSTLAGLLR